MLHIFPCIQAEILGLGHFCLCFQVPESRIDELFQLVDKEGVLLWQKEDTGRCFVTQVE